jgi:hypothetical protein
MRYFSSIIYHVVTMVVFARLALSLGLFQGHKYLLWLSQQDKITMKIDAHTYKAMAFTLCLVYHVRRNDMKKDLHRSMQTFACWWVIAKRDMET